LEFQPKGVSHIPTEMHEVSFESSICVIFKLLIALYCVATAVREMHSAGYMHRDIRWLMYFSMSASLIFPQQNQARATIY
jgi:hypothetical protein